MPAAFSALVVVECKAEGGGDKEALTSGKLSRRNKPIAASHNGSKCQTTNVLARGALHQKRDLDAICAEVLGGGLLLCASVLVYFGFFLRV